MLSFMLDGETDISHHVHAETMQYATGFVINRLRDIAPTAFHDYALYRAANDYPIYISGNCSYRKQQRRIAGSHRRCRLMQQKLLE